MCGMLIDGVWCYCSVWTVICVAFTTWCRVVLRVLYYCVWYCLSTYCVVLHGVGVYCVMMWCVYVVTCCVHTWCVVFGYIGKHCVVLYGTLLMCSS